MDRKGKLIVLDFDDTLFFTHGAIKGATKELFNRSDMGKEAVRKLPIKTKTRIYELAYSKYKHESRPNLQLLSHLKTSKKGYKIIVLTARSRKLNRHTTSLIKKHKIKISGFYSRADITEKDEEWKLKRLKQYAKKYALVEFYEDKKENIDYIKERMNADNVKFYLVKNTHIEFYP